MSFFPYEKPYDADKEGEQFYQKAHKTFGMVNQTSMELYDLGKQVILSGSEYRRCLSTVFFPDMLIAFQKACPGIPVELYEYGSIRAAQLVEEDMLDLALVNMNFMSLIKLNSSRIMKERLVFCVSPEHPFSRKKK